jgi:hypothetical protein
MKLYHEPVLCPKRQDRTGTVNDVADYVQVSLESFLAHCQVPARREPVQRLQLPREKLSNQSLRLSQLLRVWNVPVEPEVVDVAGLAPVTDRQVLLSRRGLPDCHF